MKNLRYTQMKDWIPLLVGVILTVLFVVFSTQIYELMYYDSEFSNEMYNEKMYFAVSMITAAISWLVAILYYWVIDYLDRWYHWLIFLVVAVIATSFVAFYYPDSVFSDLNLDFTTQLWTFSLINACVGLVVYLIATISTKSLSSHCSATPF